MKDKFAIPYYLLSLLCCLSACQATNSSSLTIATAANMQFAMQALLDAFRKETQVDCALVVSSSGKLTAQLKAGAPYHVFVSADEKYPRRLFEDGLTKEAPAVYAYGQLVLWSLLPNFQPSIDKLVQAEVRHIALANPKTAPYGVAALEVLEHYELQEVVAEKLVYGESVAQTNRFISSRAVELGFTALSVVQSEAMRGKGQWITIDAKLYQPLAQAAVVIQRKGKIHPAADQFYAFLFSSKAQEILKDFGYLMHE